MNISFRNNRSQSESSLQLVSQQPLSDGLVFVDESIREVVVGFVCSPYSRWHVIQVKYCICTTPRGSVEQKHTHIASRMKKTLEQHMWFIYPTWGVEPWSCRLKWVRRAKLPNQVIMGRQTAAVRTYSRFLLGMFGSQWNLRMRLCNMFSCR